jgi:hypothetical protein
LWEYANNDAEGMTGLGGFRKEKAGSSPAEKTRVRSDRLWVGGFGEWQDQLEKWSGLRG